MSSILAWRSLITPLLLTLALVFGVNYLTIEEDAGELALDPPADAQDVYVLGNSMFGTGLDLELLRSRLPGERVDFGYYNGHYTSMWYLAATRGMMRRTAPETVVWGFRPTYAILPAFRQNAETAETVFAADAPARYNEILRLAGDPTRADLPGKEEDADEQVNFSGRMSTEPFERFGAIAAEYMKLPFAGLNGDKNVLRMSVDGVSGAVNSAGASLGLSDLDPAQGNRPTDLLISYVTEGRIQKADALVVDNGESFVQGKNALFEDSFVPEITQAFEALGTNQVVVIFKPVNSYYRPMDPEVQAFYEAALDYFSDKDIRVIDLVADPSLERAYFARGDHYTQEGARYVTGRIADALTGER